MSESECEMRVKTGTMLQVERFSADDTSPKKSKTRSHSLNYLRFFPDLILSVGLFLAWYVRWQYYLHGFLLYLGVAGVCLLFGHIFVYYYCKAIWMGSLVSLWFGCLIGVVTLFDIGSNVPHTNQNIEEVANLFLVCSVLCLLLVELSLKCCLSRLSGSVPPSWCRCQIMHLVGFGVACLLRGGDSTLPLLLLILAFSLVLYAIQMGSFLTILNGIFLIVSAETYLCPDLNLSVNPYGMICLVGRVSVTPLIDLVLGAQCKLEKWRSVILMRRVVQRFLLLALCTLQATFFVGHASVVSQHKEWYVVVPFFAVCSCFWLLIHLIVLMICLTLIIRFSQCKEHISVMDSSLLALKKVLAARGLRYFSLVAYRLVYISIASTISLALICWTTRTFYNHALLSATVAIETLIAELLRELSVSLGGTCIGYGLIAPVTALRQDGMVNVLPPNFIQEAGSRSTVTLQAIVDFFTHHMITNFGCDWSMQGVQAKALDKKLREFFSCTTFEGPRYDTYLLYYSGPTTTNGDWALTDNQQMDLSELLSIWSQCNAGAPSRLLLICDAEHSTAWIKGIKSCKEECLALQTCKLIVRQQSDVLASIGQFTSKWVDVNSGLIPFTTLASETFRCVYCVSPSWSDFDFHLPSTEETTSYWLNTLPRLTHCCIRASIKLLSTGAPNICESCSRGFRRCRLRWFPPTQYDIGHGFKLLLN